MDFNESQTKQNLAWSFAAECQAGARYQFMATQAQNEQLFYIKDTMKMIAKNEMAHAKLFYDYIVDKSGETKVNFDGDYPYVELDLKNSLCSEKEIEQQEFEEIYPSFAKIAEEEGFDDVATSFLQVASIEQTHAELLSYLCKGYKDNSLYKSKVKRLNRCSNCGNVDMLSEGWKKCPVCNLAQGYIQIDFGDIFTECASSKSKKTN